LEKYRFLTFSLLLQSKCAYRRGKRIVKICK